MDNQNKPPLPNGEENQPIDFSNLEYLKSIEPLLIAQEDWNTNEKDRVGFDIGYVDGQENMVTILKRMLELQLPFEEMKKQLMGFVMERESFIKYADIRNPSKFEP